MSTAPCPTRSEIEDLLAGRLCFERHVLVEGHVRACADCQAVVDELAEPHDAFLSTLREALDASPIRARRPLRQALERLKSLHDGQSRPQPLAEGVGPWAPLPPAAAGILGDYRILRELGRGGMGIVYEAEQISLGRRVALKILPFAPLLDPRQLQRFQNEARAVATLDHSNIVTVYGVGVERGVHYFAMRYIDGHNLAQIIDQLRLHERTAVSGGSTNKIHSDATPNDRSNLADLLHTHAPIDPAYLAAVARVGIQTAEALDYAHERGIVHRDVKPSNLMLDQTGRLWITDFGLARIEADPTISMSGGVLGTLRYMSPEQALGKRGLVDHRSDIYSLGATLYELLTLTPIFPEATREMLPARIASDEPRPPRHLNPRIPSELETILLKAMAKNAAERYETAGELAADLKRFVEARPILARPVGRARRVLKWTRRRPAVAALGAISAMAALALMAGGWWHAASLQNALTVTERLRSEADAQRLEAETQRRVALKQKAITQDRENRVRHFLYAADMRQAFAAWNNSHPNEMIDLLERHRPKAGEDDLRNFAWYYLWGLCHSDLLTLRGHSRDARCVAISADGRSLATASFDGTAKLWDAVTGKERATLLKGHKEELNAVAFSPDGKTLATGGDDRAVRLWDIESGQQRAVLVGHTDDVNTVAFSPDGKRLASGSLDRVAKLWDVSTGKEIAALAGHRGAVEALAFSPDGKMLATASGDKTAILWDLSANKPRIVLRGHANRADHTDVVYAVAFAHNGRTVATGSEDRTIKLWDAASGQEKTTLPGHNDVVRSIAFSPDDRILAAALSNGSVWLWDAVTHKLVRRIHGHVGRIWSVVFSPDGKNLATAGNDCVVKLWRANVDQAARYVSGLPARIQQFDLSSDGKWLAVSYTKPEGHTPPPELWEIGSTIVRRSLQLPDCRHVALAAAGNALAVRTGTDRPWHIDIYDGPAWRWRAAFDPREPPSCLVWSPDGRILATGSSLAVEAATIRLWDTASGHQRAMRRQQGSTGIYTIAFSSDGATLGSGDFSGMLTLWDVDGLRERSAVQAHTGTVFGLAFAPDGGMLATGSGDHVIKIWDADTLRERATLQGHRDTVKCLAFSPDGATLASGSDDGTIRLWDIYTLQELVVLQAHEHGIGQLAFTADGRTLVSGGTSATGTGEVAFWLAPLQRAAFDKR